MDGWLRIEKAKRALVSAKRVLVFCIFEAEPVSARDVLVSHICEAGGCIREGGPCILYLRGGCLYPRKGSLYLVSASRALVSARIVLVPCICEAGACISEGNGGLVCWGAGLVA